MGGMDLVRYRRRLDGVEAIRQSGRVTRIVGLVIESLGPSTSVGELCDIVDIEGRRIPAEVVGFRGQRALLMPFGSMSGIAPGSDVIAAGRSLRVPVGDGLLGRILDGVGRPMDGKGPLAVEEEVPVEGRPAHPLRRDRITEPLATGVRAIDALCTCGRGQRLGIFSGSGIGKSVLLGMISRSSEADVNVIALIGERGREVREFLEKDLGQEGLKRSVVVVATSDQPALVRVKGAQVAAAIAEHFRERGRHVIWMMDSITRFAVAQREIGLSIGEPPTTKGHTPSVFAVLPRVLERAGTSERGSITGLFTVLVEADDMNEPVADAVRAILDGHLVLSRELAAQGHYPAIDVLESLSRVMIDIVAPEHLMAANRLREWVAVYRRARDLIDIGAYVPGSNAKIDEAMRMIEPVNAFLRQGIDEAASYAETVNGLLALAGGTPAVSSETAAGSR